MEQPRLWYCASIIKSPRVIISFDPGYARNLIFRKHSTPKEPLFAAHMVHSELNQHEQQRRAYTLKPSHRVTHTISAEESNTSRCKLEYEPVHHDSMSQMTGPPTHPNRPNYDVSPWMRCRALPSLQKAEKARGCGRTGQRLLETRDWKGG